MDLLKSYNYKGVAIHVMVKADGSVWFNPKEICLALGYKRDKDKASKVMKELRAAGAAGRIDGIWINSLVAYKLIATSYLKSSVSLLAWLSEEVLPNVLNRDQLDSYLAKGKAEELDIEVSEPVVELVADKGNAADVEPAVEGVPEAEGLRLSIPDPEAEGLKLFEFQGASMAVMFKNGQAWIDPQDLNKILGSGWDKDKICKWGVATEEQVGLSDRVWINYCAVLKSLDRSSFSDWLGNLKRNYLYLFNAGTEKTEPTEPTVELVPDKKAVETPPVDYFSSHFRGYDEIKITHRSQFAQMMGLGIGDKVILSVT